MKVTLLRTQASIKTYKKQENVGRVLIIRSIYSVLASKKKSAYVTAKHIQLSFVRA